MAVARREPPPRLVELTVNWDDRSMSLAPVTASPLTGRPRKRGRLLRVTGPRDEVVVEAAFRPLAAPAEAVFETAAGRHRVEFAGASEVWILDQVTGHSVAVARTGAVVLSGGEMLTWKASALPIVRFRLGDSLWVASHRWMFGRRFRAELSPVMLDRGDASLLAGIASILTQHAVNARSGLWAALAGP